MYVILVVHTKKDESFVRGLARQPFIKELIQVMGCCNKEQKKVGERRLANDLAKKHQERYLRLAKNTLL